LLPNWFAFIKHLVQNREIDGISLGNKHQASLGYPIIQVATYGYGGAPAYQLQDVPPMFSLYGIKEAFGPENSCSPA